MKRFVAIVAAGLIACAAGYFGVYHFRTAPVRTLVEDQAPELGWLKQEYHLSDAEFERISKLHAAYQSDCAEKCRRIDAKNAEIKEALAKANGLTPEIEKKLVEAQQLRIECQTAMLKHFFAVSQSMPPGQGRRYLAWVEDQTFPSGQGMAHMHEH